MRKILFKSDEALIRLDMSEYSESYSTSKLIGSAPGYVGYEERVSVFEKIRKRPYALLLLDEIEKAHPDVISLFLQIFDYGFIKDSAGRKISFRNAYIIMTSNVGATIGNGIGFLGNNSYSAVEQELKNRFKSEFINRIDEIILFNPLNLEDLYKITQNKINDVMSRIVGFPIDLTVSDKVIHYIAKQALQKNMGARPIDRIISKEIEAPIAKLILSKGASEISRAKIDLNEERITLIKQCPQLQG